MGSMAVHYTISTDTYVLSYQPMDDAPGMQPEGEWSDGELVPEDDWTAFVSPFGLSPNAGIGLTLKLQSEERLELLAHGTPPAATDTVTFVQFPADQQMILRVECEAGILRYSHSTNFNDWTEVASFSPASPVVEVGLVLRYDRDDFAAQGFLAQPRLLQGIWQNVMEDVELGMPDALPARRGRVAAQLLDAPSVQSTAEPLVHAIVGAQFGDLEFDIGKSVRWVTWFCDNVFVLDVNLGTQRYWVVNWAETFPRAKHRVTGINYFFLPAEFRKEQWRMYQQCFGVPADNDWILFVDGHEGLGIDNRSLPDDYLVSPFKSFLWREIQRAQDLGESSAVLPMYVFLRSDHITNVTYDTKANDLSGDVPPVLQALSVPYYQANQGMRRLWNAAALRDPDFDWSQIDQPETPSSNAKAQILSYAYAHWNLQDIVPPATTVEPLNASNDDGYRMRQLISMVRPVDGIPFDPDTWIPPEDDPAGLAGPWAPADANNPDPIDPATGDPIPQPVPADSSLLSLVTPLYDCVFRINMRDGVWYEQGESGNIPLRWDDEKQMWVSDYNPNEWAVIGVDAYDAYYVPPPLVGASFGFGPYGSGPYGGKQ